MRVFDFPIDPARTRVTYTFRTIESNVARVGPERHRTKSGPVRTWELAFRQGWDVANRLWRFYTERRGAWEAFLFRDPHTGEQHVARFADDEMSRTVFWRRYHEGRIRIIEVLQDANNVTRV